MKALAAILILAALGGCGLAEVRRDRDSAYADTMCSGAGFAYGSADYAACFVEMVKARNVARGGSAPASRPMMTKPGITRTEVDNAIRESARLERIQSQTMRHGMGGCVPNMATGGCL